jgi:putative tryptophan/tyrosine transport system substrate-binding protein
MIRRDLFKLVGAVVTWPFAARAQLPALPVIGFLNSASQESYASRIAAFRQGLGAGGFVESKDVAIEFHHADGHYDRLPAMAADLVRRQVRVIVTASTPAVLAAKAATTTIPIVFSGSNDPVALGLVASLARPGGNITGITRLNVEVGAKRFQLLHDTVPSVTVFALLVNPTNPALSESISQSAEVAARMLGLTLHVLQASNEREIEGAFATLLQLRAGALVIGPDAFFILQTAQLAALAVRHKMPMISEGRAFVAAGGLMSYGGDLDEGYRVVGAYAARILKGEKPSDLPVQQSTRLELFINLRTAQSLGVTVPPTMLGTADEVIE